VKAKEVQVLANKEAERALLQLHHSDHNYA